ncbi:hypothetical protein [Modestobacter italicus]|nr:hypothetical protein [Modestobacter italicus]
MDHGLTFLGQCLDAGGRAGDGWGCDRPAVQRADRQRTPAARSRS